MLNLHSSWVVTSSVYHIDKVRLDTQGQAERFTALTCSAACAAMHRTSHHSDPSLPNMLAPSGATARVASLNMMCSGKQDYVLMACYMMLDPF